MAPSACGICAQDPAVAALAQVLEDLEAELESVSVEVSKLELIFFNASNIFLQTHRQFWLLLPGALSLSQNKISQDPSEARARFQKGKLRHSGVRQLGQHYAGISTRAVVGPSLHLVEFVRVVDCRERGWCSCVCHQP